MWCYENDNENKIRYILGEKGTSPLFCIGINPSTAEPNNLDPTVNRVKVISLRNGFDSWFMLNIYPQRATNPNDIENICHSEYHQKNIDFINRYLSKYDKPKIWAAWGNLIEKRTFLFECLKDIIDVGRQNNAEWITFGDLTKKRNPRHPLYLPIKSKQFDFDIINYLEKKH